jgi:SNF2 family DNA or RNA helicase
MALRLHPVRVLIADDVGVGKTIEAALIGRDLFDRGDVLRLCVLCPPHLCDQWQRELELKFQIQARVVRTSTIARLERDLPHQGLSPYQHFPHLVASIDFIKTDRHKHDFLAHCPDLIIVDEAHTATLPGGCGSREQQPRYELVSAIATRLEQHLLLLTATPHSGIEEGFLSLLGMLNVRFEKLNLQALTDAQRINLAKYFVQRRRADVEKWMGAETRFPKRDPKEETYSLSKEYRKLFDDVLTFTREIVQEPGLTTPRQRVRYWAALALLRSVMSSPAAARLAFSKREDKLKPPGGEETADETTRKREVMDPLVQEGLLDSVPEAAVAVREADL